MDQPEEVQNQIPKITDDLQPKSEEEGGKRFVYFASQMRYLARELMGNFWLNARDGKYGNGVQKAILQGISDNLYSNAVKEVCCVSIYLVMLDQGGAEASAWLFAFLKGSQQVIDKLIVGLPAKEIMQVHEYSQGYDIEKASASYLCHMLGFKEGPDFPIEGITAIYSNSKNTRDQLLLTALTESIEVIDKHLSEIKN